MDKVHNITHTEACSLLQALYFTGSVILGGYLLALGYQNQGNVSLLAIKKVLVGESNLLDIFSSNKKPNNQLEFTHKSSYLYQVSNYTKFELDDENSYFSQEYSVGLPGLLFHFMFNINNSTPKQAIDLLNRLSSANYSLQLHSVPLKDNSDDYEYFWVANGKVSVPIKKPIYKVFRDEQRISDPALLLETFIQLYSYEEVKLIMATHGWLHKFDNKRLQHYNIILEYDDTGKFQKMRYR
ncbi:hypothetical protein [Pseudoalteromonas pernae]|uniref:hypothetical protein n=1 Tax=Pseudoalteromonas pernae TaxID=3118054 RepID=UPI003241DD4F